MKEFKNIMTSLPEEKEPGLMTFAGNHRFLTYMGCILSGISAVFSLVPFLYIWMVIRDMVNALPKMADSTVLVHYGWMAVAFSLLSMLIYFGALMCTHLSAFRTARNLKTAALHHLGRLPIGYFKTKGSGKIRRVIDDGAGQTETFLAHQLPDLSGALVTPVAVLVLLFTFDWRFGLISLIPMVIGVLFLGKMMGPGMKDCMTQYQAALGDMNNEAVEYVRGIPVVKTFQQSVFSFKSFHDSIMRYKKWAVNYTLSMRIPMCSYTVSINAVFLFLIPAGFLLLGNLAAGRTYTDCLLDLTFYLFFTPIGVSMMNKIMWTSENTMMAKDALGRILEILREEPLEEPEKPESPASYRIIFEHVTFSYKDGNKEALKDLSFVIPEGGVTALVGKSGGGKTTAASLIPRFYDMDEGSIQIGGVDVRNMKTEELMRQVAFVFQDSHLFKDSLLNNIKAARPDASAQEVEEAIKLAQCQDIIDKMPQGLETVVGTKGVYLSGGEAQRIALARAALKDAPVILLDEATAFADPDNEYRIQKAFQEITKGKTVLMIAHRLSTIRKADQIIVLEEGQALEQGTHQSLMEQDGIYAGMWKEYQTAAEWKVEKEAVK